MSTLPFVDEPMIPMDDNVLHFLDMSLPHSRLLELSEDITDFKSQVVD